MGSLAVLVTLAVAYAPVAAADPPRKHLGVIERVVAVVGHEAIFLSELRTRGKPFDKAIEKALPNDDVKRAAAHAQMQKELLEKLIDEKIVASEASRLRLSVTDADIDTAMKTIIAQQKLTLPELMSAITEQGLTEADYREELGRQILEGKLLQIRVLPKIKDFSSLSEVGRAERLESERRMWLDERRKTLFIEKRL